MPEFLHDHPAAWRSDQILSRDDWSWELSRSDLDEIDTALEANRDLPYDKINVATFPLQELGEKLLKIQDALENGSGAAMVRNFPSGRYSEEDSRRILFGCASYIGTPVSQSATGEKIFSVRDAGFKDDDPNAFALPGGKMGVYTGMLKVAENQDQLAAVLGHEVGHVLAQHGNERMSQQQLTNVALAAAAGSGYVDSASMQALGLGAQIGILLPYSRSHESEADVIGLDLMAEAGFDPRESVQLWRNMGKAGGGAPPEFMSTHPAGNTRIDNLLSHMADALHTYNDARARGNKPQCQ